MAIAGGFLYAPDVYMNKIAVGGGVQGMPLILLKPAENKAVAKCRGVDVGDIVVCILDRPRHAELISQVRAAGGRIMLIDDGDVSAVIATSQPDTGVDMYMGIERPSEVLAAAALRCTGGFIQGRLLFRNEAEKKRADKCGITDLDRKYGLEELAHGDVMFAATGDADSMLHGVRQDRQSGRTHSVVMVQKQVRCALSKPTMISAGSNHCLPRI